MEGKARLKIDSEGGEIRVNVVGGVEQILKYLPYERALTLEPVEALYLLYIGAAEAEDAKGNPVNFQDLIRLYTLVNPYAWVEFEVYLDLRKRGRLPVPGPRRHTFLLLRSKRKKQYTKYILVLEENRPVKISAIKAFVEEAFKNNWEPLLAIVDRYGDITYYSVMIFHPSKLGRMKQVDQLQPQPA